MTAAEAMNIHHLQRWPDSCVAASMCMIQRWRGEDPSEARFHGQNPRRDPMTIHRTLPRVHVRELGPGQEHELALPLVLGRPVIVTAMASLYEPWCSRTYPRLQSPHGRMGQALHMIVLVSRVRDGYRLLDPFYPGEPQPLEVSDDDFERWFAGHAFIAHP